MSKTLSEMTLEELWQLFPIQLSEHKSNWADWYEEECSRLVSILGTDIARIDHIGSTAVAGLIALYEHNRDAYTEAKTELVKALTSQG